MYNSHSYEELLKLRAIDAQDDAFAEMNLLFKSQPNLDRKSLSRWYDEFHDEFYKFLYAHFENRNIGSEINIGWLVGGIRNQLGAGNSPRILLHNLCVRAFNKGAIRIAEFYKIFFMISQEWNREQWGKICNSIYAFYGRAE